MNKSILILIMNTVNISSVHAMHLIKGFKKPAQQFALPSVYKMLISHKTTLSTSHAQEQNNGPKRNFSKLLLLTGAASAIAIHRRLVLADHESYTDFLVYKKNTVSNKLLLYGVHSGKLAVIDAAFALGANPNVREEAEENGLPSSAPHTHLRARTVVELAIDECITKGADVTIVQKLIDHGADIGAKFGSTPPSMRNYVDNFLLFKVLTCENGHELQAVQLVTILIKAGLDVNQPTLQLQQTPLMLAITHSKSLDVVKSLLLAKPDLARKDYEGLTIEDHIALRKENYPGAPCTPLDLDRLNTIQQLIDAYKKDNTQPTW